MSVTWPGFTTLGWSAKKRQGNVCSHLPTHGDQTRCLLFSASTTPMPGFQKIGKVERQINRFGTSVPRQL